jgi:hypothetical protein
MILVALVCFADADALYGAASVQKSMGGVSLIIELQAYT